MQISLRKANAIQQKIREAINELNLSGLITVDIGEFADAEEELNAGTVEFFAAKEKFSELVSVLFVIRGLVDAANHECGISHKLTEMAEHKMVKESLECFKGVKPMKQLREIKQNQLKLQTSATSGFRSDRIASSVLNDADIITLVDEYRAAELSFNKVKDEVDELNITTKITLPESAVLVLSNSRII